MTSNERKKVLANLQRQKELLINPKENIDLLSSYHSIHEKNKKVRLEKNLKLIKKSYQKGYADALVFGFLTFVFAIFFIGVSYFLFC